MVTLRCGSATFPNIQGIVLDKDGTLADVAAYLKSLGQKRSRLIDAQVPGVQEPLLMAFGLDRDRLDPAGLLAVGSQRENAIAAAAYIAETGCAWAEALQMAELAFTEAASYLKRKAEHTPVFPAIPGWLAALKAQGLTLGILSADTPENIVDFMAYAELTPYIQAYHGVTGTLSKPDPQLYLEICHKLQLAPEQTIMVGDSTADMQMARAAGAAGTIGVTWGWATPVKIQQADAVINAPTGLHISI